ncbi:MAG: hypothetical protein VX686_04685 [Candidatus Thermoplasmatota archaeon]|nr:hypothetical protein [Candidatus Thermoplasmatota archaeon]
MICFALFIGLGLFRRTENLRRTLWWQFRMAFVGTYLSRRLHYVYQPLSASMDD